MPQRPSKLARAITASFVAGGVTVAVLAVVAAVHDPTSDAAWVAIPLGVLLVVWGVAFARMRADDGPDEDEDVEARPSNGFLGAPLARLSWVIALLAGYVAARLVGRPVDSSLVAVGSVVALWLVNRAVDRWVRRREARDGDVGPVTD
ncbi:hypothetical protein ABC270_15500 [Curtobacterium sp. 1P10AnD]|uniref:hypothetical protein n=1 Tax=Curtobacterium sp. 1P10AnD TaxID=3132283 RepID=UPI0039A01E09